MAGQPPNEIENAFPRRAHRAQSGQGMVEYALILVLVSVVVIVILITQGGTMLNMFSNISATLHSDGHM